MQLVLSLFPGIGLLDMAFEQEGFCVVRGPDVLWGGDIRRFNPPAGKFDGVIGGPPCQSFSKMVHLVRHNGASPSHGNLIPEFERCVREARPTWYVMENVPDAPVPVVTGYATWSGIVNNRQCLDENGQPGEQSRARRWTFGDVRTGKRSALMLDVAALESMKWQPTVTASEISKGMPTGTRAKFTGRSDAGYVSRSLSEICRLQGLPEDFDVPPFRVDAKCRAIGNGVPLPMGRAIAKAVREATEAQ